MKKRIAIIGPAGKVIRRLSVAPGMTVEQALEAAGLRGYLHCKQGSGPSAALVQLAGSENLYDRVQGGQVLRWTLSNLAEACAEALTLSNLALADLRRGQTAKRQPSCKRPITGWASRRTRGGRRV